MADALENLADERWQLLKSGVRFCNLPAIERPPIPDVGGRLQTESGQLARIVNGSTIRFIAYIEFDPKRKAARGNHFHGIKTEIIYLMSGCLEVSYLAVDPQGAVSPHLETVLHHSGDLIVIPPRVVHRYMPRQRSHGLELASTTYVPGDTHEYILSPPNAAT